uniref:hypothetical protein n=1 Tax=Arthrobacter silvisoli TaxID=2291022 RepID=UPI003F4944A2
MTAPDEFLAPIRERLAAATPGPWHFDTDADDYLMSPAGEVPPSLANGEFIAHAREDVPRLLAALDGVLALHQPSKVHRQRHNAEGTLISYTVTEDGPCEACYPETGTRHCEDCNDYDDLCEGVSESWRVSWPCPTVAAITTALEGQA